MSGTSLVVPKLKIKVSLTTILVSNLKAKLPRCTAVGSHTVRSRLSPMNELSIQCQAPHWFSPSLKSQVSLTTILVSNLKAKLPRCTAVGSHTVRSRLSPMNELSIQCQAPHWFSPSLKHKSRSPQSSYPILKPSCLGAPLLDRTPFDPACRQ